MLREKDFKIIPHLRNNSRKKITQISKELGIPVTTVYDRIKAQEKKLIRKYTALMNFSALGYHTKALIALKISSSREEFEKFIKSHPNTNSFYKINYDYDYLVEAVFRDMKEANDFTEQLRCDFGVLYFKTFFILDDIEREIFLPKNE